MSDDVWVRMVGILALALGVCDVLAAHDGVASLIHGSVWRWLAAGVCIGLLVLLGLLAVAMCRAPRHRRDCLDAADFNAVKNGAGSVLGVHPAVMQALSAQP